MKKIILYIVIFLLIVFLLVKSHHTIINIPNEGKIKQIELREIFRIIGEDDEERYFFRDTRWIKADEQGNIFVLDQEQFLVFNAQGKFLRNLFKKGEGPGEVNYITNYLPGDSSILMHNGFPNKLVEVDKSGRFIKEQRIYIDGYLQLVSHDKDRIYFLFTRLPNTKGKAKIVDVDNVMASLPYDKVWQGEKRMGLEEVFVFPVIGYVCMGGEGFGMLELNYLKYAHIKDSLFYFANEEEYEIKLVDMEKKKVLKILKRFYERKRVRKETGKYLDHGAFVIEDKIYRAPRLEYFNDIQSIHFCAGKLWVFTSTVDAKRGVLVDRWDMMGKLVDQVFLKFQNFDTHYRLKQDRMYLTKEYLYIIELDREENREIVKYRIKEH